MNLQHYLDRNGIPYEDDGETDDGRTKLVIQCPFNPQHDGKDACLFQDSEGKIGFHCFHDSCAGYGWQSVKAEIGPLLPEDFDIPEGVSVSHVIGEPHTPRSGWKSGFIKGKEFFSGPTEIEYLVEGVVAKGGHLIIGGAKKTLKTSITMDLVISLAYGVPFLGEFEVPEPVACGFISGESGDVVLRRNGLQICKSKGVDPYGPLEDNFVIGFNLPGLSVEEHIRDVINEIEENNIKLLIIDPIYLSFLKGSTQKISMGDIFQVGAVLDAYGSIARTTGCTMALIHHNRKGAGRDEFRKPDMGDLSQAGFAEWGRQFLLLSRREPFHNDGFHPLQMVLGGSTHRGGYWHLDIDEGMDDDELIGPRWDVNLRVPEAPEDDREVNITDCENRIRQIIARAGSASKTRLMAEGRLSEGQVLDALTTMINQGEVQIVTRGHLRLYEFSENIPILA